MVSFTPPLRDGNPMTSAEGTKAANALMRHYGSVAQGITVWKDQGGVWHESMTPYAGGATHAQHNNWVGGVGPTSTTQGPDEGLATAQKVYMGGHTYDLNLLDAIDLFLGGYVLGGHKDDEEQKWINYALTSVPNAGYKGGDGCSSLKRPGGESLWFFADTFVGTVTADGIYIGALPVRNSFIVLNSDGSIGSQVYAVGSSGNAFNHLTVDHWYWPIDVINDGTGTSGDVVIAAWDVTLGGVFGHLSSNALLELNGFGQVVATYTIPFLGEKFMIQSIMHDDAAGYHYVHGLEYENGYDTYSLNTNTYARLARVPIGSLRAPAQWQWWTGSFWANFQADSRRIVDSHGNLIEGNVDMCKVGDSYVLASLCVDSPAVTLYKSALPQGPWVRYHVEDSPKNAIGGAVPPHPSMYAYYLPKFHEHLNPSADQLVISYNRNTFGWQGGPSITSLHVSTFTPQFLWLPGP